MFPAAARRRALLSAVVSTAIACAAVSPPSPQPPPTHRDDFRETLHGVELTDPYHWLEDGASAATRAWIAAQGAYTQALLGGLPERAAARRRLSELLHVDSVEAPVVRGGRYFFLRRLADQDLSVLCLRQGPDGPDEVLVDPHPLSPDHRVSVDLVAVAPDGAHLLYALRQGGEDEIEVRVLDVAARRDLPDALPRALYGGVFTFRPDGRGFYYTLRDRKEGPRVRYHALGTAAEHDPELFGQGYGPDVYLDADPSADGRYLLFGLAHGTGKSEAYLQDLRAGGPPRVVVRDLDARSYFWFAGDHLLVKTNWQAPRYRILEVDPADPAPAKWRQLVAEGPDAIDRVSTAAGRLFVGYLHDAASRIAVFDLAGGSRGDLPLPALGAASPPEGSFAGHEAFFYFNSFTVPWSAFRYDTATGRIALWSHSGAAFASDRYLVKQVWYTSKDGTRVPMFLVHRKGIAQDGRRPTLLYGYGGFSLSVKPNFSPFVALWLERGGVYASANLRGGGEFGDAWHRAGMLDKKQNVFDDFSAAAEWLIANRYTRPARLAIEGGSNGGLLVGAAITQRPDLFRAALCLYPELDMVRLYRLPGAWPQFLSEYGSAADPEPFKYLRAYSPYENVQPGTKYPAVLLVSGDGDTRVPPLQARKMTARLQAATTSGHPVALLYDTLSGHSGEKPTGQLVDDLSLEMAFLLHELGVGPTDR